MDYYKIYTMDYEMIKNNIKNLLSSLWNYVVGLDFVLSGVNRSWSLIVLKVGKIYRSCFWHFKKSGYDDI